MRTCNCGPRECLHPSNLLEGFQCKVATAGPPTAIREQIDQLKAPERRNLSYRLGYEQAITDVFALIEARTPAQETTK